MSFSIKQFHYVRHILSFTIDSWWVSCTPRSVDFLFFLSLFNFQVAENGKFIFFRLPNHSAVYRFWRLLLTFLSSHSTMLACCCLHVVNEILIRLCRKFIFSLSCRRRKSAAHIGFSSELSDRKSNKTFAALSCGRRNSVVCLFWKDMWNWVQRAQLTTKFHKFYWKLRSFLTASLWDVWVQQFHVD